MSKDGEKEDFFKRKEAKGVKLPETGPFDLNAENDLLACGINIESFQERSVEGNKAVEEMLDANKDTATLAHIVVELDRYLTKRELAYIVATNFTNAVMNEAKQQQDGK